MPFTLPRSLSRGSMHSPSPPLGQVTHNHRLTTIKTICAYASHFCLSNPQRPLDTPHYSENRFQGREFKIIMIPSNNPRHCLGLGIAWGYPWHFACRFFKSVKNFDTNFIRFKLSNVSQVETDSPLVLNVCAPPGSGLIALLLWQISPSPLTVFSTELSKTAINFARGV